MGAETGDLAMGGPASASRTFQISLSVFFYLTRLPGRIRRTAPPPWRAAAEREEGRETD